MIIPSREETECFVEGIASNAKLEWEHSSLIIPNSIDFYLEKIVDKDVRTQYRKATRLGYTVKRTINPSNNIKDIWHSWDGDKKQGREMNPMIGHFVLDLRERWSALNGWPFHYYDKTEGYLEFWECYTSNGEAVAYTEVGLSDTNALILQLLGHKEHYKNGVMKMLFVDLVRDLIDRGIDKLWYYKRNSTLEADRKFKESRCFSYDLGFRFPEERMTGDHNAS